MDTEDQPRAMHPGKTPSQKMGDVRSVTLHMDVLSHPVEVDGARSSRTSVVFM
jgi:hypothetical protein